MGRDDGKKSGFEKQNSKKESEKNVYACSAVGVSGHCRFVCLPLRLRGFYSSLSQQVLLGQAASPRHAVGARSASQAWVELEIQSLSVNQ